MTTTDPRADWLEARYDAVTELRDRHAEVRREASAHLDAARIARTTAEARAAYERHDEAEGRARALREAITAGARPYLETQ